MPALRNAGKNLSRLREISSIIARHGFGEVLDRARVFDAIHFRPRADVPPAERKLSGAARFRMMLGDLGPTFVKLGQVLSSRPDILPPEFIRELSTLQDRVPPLPIEQARRAVEEGLGRRIEDVFSCFDEAPIASASIAQVHAATTIEGEDVVVKVQRPGIKESIRADLDLLYYLAQFLERVVEETGIYTPTGIVEEFERGLGAELDFLNEAANVRLFLRNNEGRPSIVIPRVFEQLTSSTVLTLERLHGEKITELDPERFDQQAVANNLIESLFTQIFQDGVFHGDPHPGNIFVLEGNRIGLIDFGLVGRLTKGMQETVIILCLAIALKDPDTVARLLYKVGVPDQRVNLAQFRLDIAEILDRYLDVGVELSQVESASLVNDMIELAMKYHIKVPKEYALLTKASITIEGVVRRLYPNLDVLGMALPYARKLLKDRISPKSASGGALRALLQFQGLVSDVPAQVSQVLMDLEGGKFSVQVKSDDLRQLVTTVRWLGFVLFSGLTAGALIVGAFFMLATRTEWEFRGVPVLAIAGLVLAAMLFGATFMGTIVGGRVHKISVRRWLGRRS